MIVVLDENLPPSIARAMSALDQRVQHAHDVVPRGTPDDHLVRVVAELGGCLFSRDGRMLHNAATVAALRNHGIRLVIFHDDGLSCFELARLMIWAWPDVQRIVRNGQHQFLEITARGQVREKKLRRR